MYKHIFVRMQFLGHIVHVRVIYKKKNVTVIFSLGSLHKTLLSGVLPSVALCLNPALNTKYGK